MSPSRNRISSASAFAVASILSVALSWCARPAVGAEAANSPSLMDGLSFYVSFDQTPNADVYRAAPTAHFDQGQKEPVLVPGRWGNALPAGSWPSYFQSYNFNAIEGSAAFWTKPEFDPATPAPHVRTALMLAYMGHVLSVDKGKTELVYKHRGTHQGDSPDNVHYDISGWKQGQWHHVAMTWSDKTGEKKLYIDGALVSQAQGRRFNIWTDPVNFATHRPNFIGNHFHTVYGQDWGGDVDELGFWQRPLSADEVRMLASTDPTLWVKKTEHTWPWESLDVRIGYPAVSGDKSGCFIEGEGLHVEVPVTNATDRARTEKFRFLLTDYYGRDAGTIEKTITLQPKQETRIPVQMNPAGRGYFRLTAQWLGANKQPQDSLDVAGCLVVAPGLAPLHDEEDSVLGAQLHSITDERNLDLAAKLGLRWTRVYTTSWKYTADPNQRNVNVWNTDQIKSTQKALARLRTMHILPLGWFLTGTHAGDNYQGEEQLAKNPDQWLKLFEEYARKTVSSYGQYISHWQIWNEANVGNWRAPLDLHSRMAEVAKRVVAELQPDAVVICPGGLNTLASNYPKAWGKLVSAGLTKDVTWASFHGGEGEDSIAKSAENYRKMFQDNGAGPMRLMIDEGYAPQGTTAYRDLRSKEMPLPQYAVPVDTGIAVNGLVKDLVLSAASDVRPFIFYDIDHPARRTGPVTPGLADFSTPYTAIEFNGFPRPMLMAFATVAHRFDGARLVKRFDVGDSVVYLFQRNGKPLAVAWLEGARASLELALPADNLALYNVMDNRVRAEGSPVKLLVGDEPLFIQAADGLGVEAMAAAFGTARLQGVTKVGPGDSLQVAPGGAVGDYTSVPNAK